MSKSSTAIWKMGNGLYRVALVKDPESFDSDDRDIHINRSFEKSSIHMTEYDAYSKAGKIELDNGGTDVGITFIDTDRSTVYPGEEDISEKLFYTPPPQKIFDEVAERAKQIWGKYDDTYSYASNKMKMVDNTKNISSGFMSIFQMFDMRNKMTLLNSISQEARNHIGMRQGNLFTSLSKRNEDGIF